MTVRRLFMNVRVAVLAGRFLLMGMVVVFVVVRMPVLMLASRMFMQMIVFFESRKVSPCHHYGKSG